ncbi:MAG: DMT family transporter [Pseudomonadota bacterium]
MTLNHHLAGSQMHVHGLMLVATLLVATSFPVAAAITEGLDTLVLTFLRFALATALFGPLVFWSHGLKLPSATDLLRYSALSLLLVTFFICMFVSLHFTTPLNTAAIFALHPVITAFLAALLLRETLSTTARFALPIGAVGAIWVVFRGDLEALLALEVGQGDVIFLAGTLALAAYSTLIKVLHRGEPMAVMTFWILATGTVWLFAFSALRLGEVEWQQVSGSIWAGIAYLSVFTTIVTFFLVQWNTTKIGPTRVASYTFLNPGLVVVLSIALGAPLPPSATWPGMLLTLLAVIVLQFHGTCDTTPGQGVRDPGRTKRGVKC